jgi:hypothetical protein
MSHDEQLSQNFYGCWTDGLNNALHDDNILLSGQEAYEIVVRAFGRKLSIDEFLMLTEADFLKLRDAARSFLENPIFEVSHMKSGFENTTRYWNGPSH